MNKCARNVIVHVAVRHVQDFADRAQAKQRNELFTAQAYGMHNLHKQNNEKNYSQLELMVCMIAQAKQRNELFTAPA